MPRPREGEGDDAAVDDLLLLRVVHLILREEALRRNGIQTGRQTKNRETTAEHREKKKKKIGKKTRKQEDVRQTTTEKKKNLGETKNTHTST